MWSSSDVAVWVLSAAIGALGILTFGTLGTPGFMLLIVPLLIAWMWSGIRRSLKAGGALAGFGTATILILAAANARCAEASTRPGESCTPPDVSLTLLAAAVALGVRLALTFPARPLHAVWRSSRRSREPHR
jgi:hypothetical protein